MRPMVCWACALTAIGLSGGSAAGQEQADPAPAASAESPLSPLRFRRIYAPAGRVQDWPRGTARYVPVDGEEFERLVKSVSASEVGAPSLTIGMVRAQYEATFDGSEGLVGTARWDVRHAARSAGLMRLAPFGLAVRSAWWRGEQAIADRQPAEIGIGADGKPVLLVDRGGQIEVAWSLHGRRDGDGRLSFPLDLPACASTELRLTLADHITPVVAGGVALAAEGAPEGSKAYRILLGAKAGATLRFSGLANTDAAQQPAILRETAVYDLSPRGLDVTAHWKVDVRRTSIDRLDLSLDPGLRLVGARWGETEARWTARTDAASGATAVTLEFPEQLAGADRSLRLAAIAPLVLDRSWRLPRIRCASLDWQEGTCTVLGREPLLVADLSADDGRPSKYALLAEPNQGESFDVQLYSRDAAVHVTLVHANAPLQLSTGTSLEVGRGGARAELVAAFQLASGHRFMIQGDVLPGWIVDSVEAIPREVMAQWRIDNTAPAGRAALSVSLARRLAADNPIKLLVRGHRAAASRENREFRSDDLEMVRFHDTRVDEKLIAVRPREGESVRVVELEHVERLDSANLGPAQTALFTELPRAALYRIDPGRGRFVVVAEDQKARFAAEVHSAATVTPDELVESYAIHCVPSGDRLSRLLIAFSEPRREPLAFRMADRRALSARRLSAEEQLSRGLPEPAEAWEVSLAHPRSAAFDILATRTSPLSRESPLSLALLPDASNQRATVSIHASADVAISTSHGGLPAVDAPQPIESTTLRGTFAYTATDVANGIRVSRQEPARSSPSAVVLHRRIASQWDASGRGWHVASFRIDNGGRSQVSLLPPRDAETSRVWVDAVRQPPANVTESAVAIPADKRFVTLAIEYSSTAPSLGLTNNLAEPVVGIDLPVLSSDWLIGLPGGYELSNVSGGSAEPTAGQLTWSQRLLGPLGRGAQTNAFDPRADNIWGPLVSASASERARFDEWLAEASAIVQSPEKDGAVLDWGQILAAAAGTTGGTLLVDAPALSAAGIAPRTPIRTDSGPATERMMGRLRAANLAVLVTPKALVVTSRLEAMIHRHELAWIAAGNAAVVRPGRLLTVIEAAVADSGDYTKAAEWADGSDPWIPVSELQTAGGGVLVEPFLIDTDLPGPGGVRIVRRSALAVLGMAASIVALACGLWLANRASVLVSALVVAAGLALVMPAPLAPLATGCLWGLAVALGWKWLAPRLVTRAVATQRESGASSNSLDLAVGRAALPAVLAAAMLANAHRTTAAPPDPAMAAGAVVHRVFIPVDDEDRPTNDKYQVPQELYEELRRRAGDASDATQRWMIRQARYQVSLNREAGTSGLVAGDVSARYEMAIMRADATVHLPIRGIRPGPVAKLDGRAVPLDWDTTEDGIVFRFDSAGTYELELSMRPPRGDSAASGLEISVPPAPRATVDVSLPSDPPSVEVASATGVVTRSADGRKLSADLGPTDRLAIQWDRAGTTRGAASTAEVDSWLWLHVQPGSVTLNARLDVKGIKAPLKELWLSVDPRLRPLAVADRSGLVAAVQATSGDPQSVRIELSRPISDPTTIPVSFLLTGSSGIGRLHMPRLSPRSSRASQCVLAVSVDPAIDFAVEPQAAGTAMAVPDFLAHWGGSPAPPQAAFRITVGQDWSIATRPRETPSTAVQTLSVDIDDGQANVLFGATITPPEPRGGAASYTLMHRLQAPPELRVEGVSVIQDGIERVSRWRQDESGKIVVFLSSRVTGPQQLSLQGSMPAPRQGRLAVPHIDLETARVSKTSVVVERQPSVDVEAVDVEGLAKASPPVSTTGALPSMAPRWLVGSYTVATDAWSAALDIRPNAPQVESTLTASISFDDKGECEGRIHYQCEVAGGHLDLVELKMPAEWSGPWEVVGAATPDVTATSSGDARLIVRPKSPVDGKFAFTLRAPLRMKQDERCPLPSLLAGPGEKLDSYVLLPNQRRAEALDWETDGLGPGRLPDFSGRQVDVAASKVFRVVEPGGTVRMRRTVAAAGPQESADVRVAWSMRGSCRGRATFEVESGRQADCLLTMPQGAELLELRVSGMLVTPWAVDDGWKVPLEPGRKQTIEVLFSVEGVSPSITGRVDLVAPTVRGHESERTSWSVYAPAAAGHGTLSASDSDLVLSHANAPSTAGLHRSWEPRGHADRWTFAGNVPLLTLHYSVQQRLDPWWRSAAALALVAVGLVAAQAAKRGRFDHFAVRAGHIAGIAVGILATAWITPAWLGLTVVAVTVLAMGVAAARRASGAEVSEVVPS